MDKVLCPYCGNPAALVTGNELYPHRPDLYYKRSWVCEPCDAYVGCHKMSNHPNGKSGTTPLGSLAKRPLRELRTKCHKLFDPMWRSGRFSRGHAYKALAKRLNIKPQDCHFSWFNDEQCKLAIAALQER